MTGTVLTANTESEPICFGVDYTEHDKEIEKKYADQTKELNKMVEQYDETIKELRQNNDLLRYEKALRIGSYKKENEELKTENMALTEKIKAYEEHYVKTSKLIREYDHEILELKAQCQKLTQNERLAYKRNNGNTADIPNEPIKIADWLIDRHMEQVEKISISSDNLEDMRKLQIDCLRQIAEHLLVVCERK